MKISAHPFRFSGLFTAFLVAGVAASCSSGGGGVVVPPADTGAPTADMRGTWAVEARITEAFGSGCAPDAVGQVVKGLLLITQIGSSITVVDEDFVTGNGSVTGNTADFSFFLMGVSEDFHVIVFDNNTRFSGEIDITGPSCIGLATVTGTKISSPANSGPTIVRTGERLSSAPTHVPLVVSVGPGVPTIVPRVLVGPEREESQRGVEGFFSNLARSH